MSTLSDMWQDFVSVIFPPVCPVCGSLIKERARTICTMCRLSAPLTHYWEQADNPLFRKFWGLLPLQHASSMIFYVKNSGWQRLIHNFKYRSAWRTALEMGQWYGALLQEGGLYADVDIVIGVPLHWRKRMTRGYNQAEYIAQGVAQSMGRELSTKAVIRHRNNPPQARTHKSERWDNVEGIFTVKHPEWLDGKHILIIDDVCTSSATITACASAILSAVPNCKISIATLAVSAKSLNIVY